MTGFIYAISSGDAVKIGWSAKPWRRFAAIQTGCPSDCTMLGLIEGSISDERELHAKFAPWKVRGEWFRRAGLVAEFIDKLPPVDARPPRRYERRLAALNGDGPLTSASAIIDVLGGTFEAARKLGKTPQAVTNWRARRMIPPELFLVVTDLIGRSGKAADPAVFRMQGSDAA